jgi:hypothetical protein
MTRYSTSSPHNNASFSFPFAAFHMLRNCYCQLSFQVTLPQCHVSGRGQNISLHLSILMESLPTVNPFPRFANVTGAFNCRLTEGCRKMIGLLMRLRNSPCFKPLSPYGGEKIPDYRANQLGRTDRRWGLYEVGMVGKSDLLRIVEAKKIRFCAKRHFEKDYPDIDY